MASDDSDTELRTLLQQLRQGDALARERLVQHSCQRLEVLTSKMLRRYPRLRRWEQTGDVLQNALLRLNRSLESIVPNSPGQFFGLAATQIRRELIDLARHHFGPEGAAARHHTDGDGELLQQQTGVSNEPITLADWSAFHEAVEALPAAERHVFDLLWYEGLDQLQAADILGVTDRTIKSRWRSAKLLLQARLGGSEHS